MSWKETVIGRIRRKENILDRFYKDAADACDIGDEEREKKMYANADRVEEYISGVLDTLNELGYVIKFDSHHNVDSIIDSNTVQYRVRYRRFDADNVSYCDNYVFCEDGDKVQEVIDRAKTVSSEYKLIGIDSRIVSPNGDGESWHKIFDF